MHTTLGVPQQSGLIASTSLGNSVSAVPPPSGLIASPSLGNSVSSLSSVPKPDGIVETSLKDEIMLDQQLTTAFQTGLRHSLDDSDHDAMSDLPENGVGLHESLDESMVAAEMNSFAASAHVSLVSFE